MPTPPRETQETIEAWREATFGPCDLDPEQALLNALNRFGEEVDELMDEDEPAKMAGELADVYLTLCGIASRLGVDLHDEVDRKMGVNRGRKWRKGAVGHGYHEDD